MPHAVITGTGLYAPERVIPNAVFDELYDDDVDGFLRERRNIVERRYAAPGETTSDLAVNAARAALSRAGLDASDVDLIVVSTDTPDFLSPSTAAVVQDKLGARGAATFDLNTACAGFVTALDTARKFVEADVRYQHVLVVGAYLMSRFIDYEQKNVASLFADGAGAAVLSASDAAGRGILASRLQSKGEYHGHMGIYTGGAACPITRPAPRPQLANTSGGKASGGHAAGAGASGADASGDGARVDDAPQEAPQETHQETPQEAPRVQRLEFRQKFPDGFNPDHWTALVHELCDALDATPGDVDRYFFTQINVESIRETLDRLGLPRDRAHNVMDRFGYTGNACVAMALADADASGRLHDGDLVFLVASGGGAAIAGMALRWAA